MEHGTGARFQRGEPVLVGVTLLQRHGAEDETGRFSVDVCDAGQREQETSGYA